MMRYILIFLLFCLSKIYGMDDAICSFATLPVEIQNRIAFFLPKRFTTFHASPEENDKYKDLCKTYFSKIRPYHDKVALLVNAAFNLYETHIALLHEWKLNTWTTEYSITTIDIQNKQVSHFSLEYQQNSSFKLIATSPQADIAAFIETEIETIPSNPCSKRLKVIQYTSENEKKSHYYCIPHHLKNVSHIAFNETGSKILIEGETIFTPEKSQPLPYQIFSLKNDFSIPKIQFLPHKKSRLEKYFLKKEVCKSLNPAKEIISQLSLDQK